jgi:hypothetical protein
MSKKIILYILLAILLLLLFSPLLIFKEGVVNMSTDLLAVSSDTINVARGATSADQTCISPNLCSAYISQNPSANTSGGPTGADVSQSGTDIDTSYSYMNFIKTPSEMNMSDKGTLETLENDINGLLSYVSLLVEGTSSASKSSKPLGNKFFAKTLGKCNDIKTSTPQDRYLYINNVPSGNIPFATDGGVRTDLKGLIPGMMGNLDVLNPNNIASAFLTQSVPDCMEITMETIDTNNISSKATHFVTLADVSLLDPCSFPADAKNNRFNPQTNKVCKKEGFSNIYSKSSAENSSNSNSKNIIIDNIETDYIAQLFLSSFGLFGIYILYKTLHKIKR